ncbi:hypothetical protein JHN59_11480 [Streptomyces sp. MBT49]|uniref:zinc finger domain-containing protein n=1 Tax=unclassified Streptomyces TaxID=2593676 RepID=UPI00190CA7AB|nr:MULTISPECIES: hypothetical protein [unclassified Streptomyces]MBK3625456.1 hypothetical protein [Streptomyces sp. MBT49]MBK3633281.1 hypothetical protein [Streptomyces sp. MBT97]
MKNRQTLTEHQAAARDARRSRGVWVAGPVYASTEVARNAARRVPAARNLSAYLPIGEFEAYGVPCAEGKGALWVRWTGGVGPELVPMPSRMTVRVPHYGDGPGRSGVGIVTVSVAPYCPVCGGPRGWQAITPDPFVRDGVTFVRDRWSNACGHKDTYVDVLAEARRTPAAPGGELHVNAPALELPALRAACPRCQAKPGALCTSSHGTRYLLVDVHRGRVDAWDTARVHAVPAAKLILNAARRREITHARQAADLIAARGYQAEADVLRVTLRIQNGHMSAKQAVGLLVDRAEAASGGEA